VGLLKRLKGSLEGSWPRHSRKLTFQHYRATHWLKQVTDKYEYCSSQDKDLREGEWLPWLQIN